jgi:hypothetical protein
MSDKFPTEQEELFRKLLKEIEEVKQIAASIPILMREPKESGPKQWIKKVLPKTYAGYTCALYRVAGVIAFIVFVPVKINSAYQFDKPYVEESAVFVQHFTDYARLRLQVVLADSPHVPSEPSAPVPWNPPAMPPVGISGGNLSNSAAYKTYIVNPPAGTSAGGITPSRVWFVSDDGTGTIKEV